ncbi:MAG TPA: peptidyl-prolyl cis-trans isomerase [Polyangiaceae bacterium]
MRRLVAAALLAAGLLAAHGDTRADDAGADARRAEVVVHLGPTRVITVGELEDRLANVPPFQRATFGKDAATVKRAFLEQVLIPEVLESLGAEAAKLGDQLPTSYALERVRSQSVVRAIRARLGPESSIPMGDVQRYYDENRSRYDTPERYQIWRILCKTKDEAQSVLDAAKKDPTSKGFADLARDRSIDKGTNLRGGNLGFITPDGASNEPGLRVDPALVKAVQGVHDGELVPAPVAEGDNWAVVWRKGTIVATKRPVDEVAAQIRDTLWKARVKDETDKLTASLRASKLRDLDEAPLALLGTTPVVDASTSGAALPAPATASPSRTPR